MILYFPGYDNGSFDTTLYFYDRDTAIRYAISAGLECVWIGYQEE